MKRGKSSIKTDGILLGIYVRMRVYELLGIFQILKLWDQLPPFYLRKDLIVSLESA